MIFSEAISFLSNDANTLVINGIGNAGVFAVSERQIIQGISTVHDVTE